MSDNDFLWTARLYEKNQLISSRYFKFKEERDQFVEKHQGWKKRGKICRRNLSLHLESRK